MSQKISRRVSLAMQDKARKFIPGVTQLLSKRPQMFAPGSWPGYFSRAKGACVWDLDGNKYIDMSIGGIGANVLGYCDPDVDRAVMKAVKQGNSSSLNCAEEVELAELLCRIHPWAAMVRYSRCGGESMAIAVRIARAHTGRDKVVICGYHGWHDWYLAANLGTANALGEHLLPGLSPAGVPKALKGTTLVFRYNDLESLKAVAASEQDTIAAIVMEPVRNVQPAPGFLEGVKGIAEKLGAVFIFDEISSGFRMNTGGSHLTYGVNPDMAVMAKAISNGYPMGAVIGTEKVMQSAQETFISSTYWTERIGPAAALATIRKHQAQKAGDHLMAIGRAVQEGWAGIAQKHGVPLTVAGIYPLGHFNFNDPDPLSMKAYFVQEMLAEGFLASNQFYSMYAHTFEHVEKYLKATDRVFARMAALRDSGRLQGALKGGPAVAGFKRVT